MAKSKTKNAAKMDSKDVKYLIEMLNKHHEELQDAQQERHDQLVADLQNIFQSGSKSPLKTIRAAGSDLNSSVAAKGVKAKSKTRSNKKAKPLEPTKVAKATPKEKKARKTADSTRPTSKPISKPKSRARPTKTPSTDAELLAQQLS